MRDCILFEIPIYSMSEKHFNEKWDKFFEKMEVNYCGLTSSTFSQNKKDNEQYIQRMKDYFFPRQLWIYNQIVGYIVIYYEKNTVWYDLFMPNLNRKFRFDRTKKVFLSNQSLGGYHFPIYKEYSNADIAFEIRERLKSISDDILKSFYMNLENFNTIYQHIDYKQIFIKTDNEYN